MIIKIENSHISQNNIGELGHPSRVTSIVNVRVNAKKR